MTISTHSEDGYWQTQWTYRAEGINKYIKTSSFKRQQFRNSYDGSMEAIKAVRYQEQERTPEHLKQMPQETCNTTRPTGVLG